MENKKFQIKTDHKIGDGKNIEWTMEGTGWFWIKSFSINSGKCNGGREFTAQDKTTMGFLQRAGILTFLKTNTQLQVWFDDVLEVTWVYEDKDEANECYMRKDMTGLKFKSPSDGLDEVTTHYRYEIGISNNVSNRRGAATQKSGKGPVPNLIFVVILDSVAD